jgi:hypothetical protein
MACKPAKEEKMPEWKPPAEEIERRGAEISCCKQTKNSESPGWVRTQSAESCSKCVDFACFLGVFGYVSGRSNRRSLRSRFIVTHPSPEKSEGWGTRHPACFRS